ncbi:MAG: HAD family hydrolase [Melioribacteraceae bacterium]|nr:HAD family hydrolase [Melioribacteraceae bacterium]
MKNFRFKHIIWDWNGTMLDDVFLCCDIMNNILRRRNMQPITLSQYRDIFTFPVREYYKNVGLPLDNGNFEKLSVEFIDEYESRKNNCSLYPGVKETLEYFYSMGLGQSVLSAYSQHTLVEIIEHFGLSRYFQKINGLDNIYAAGKIDNGRKWIKELGLKKGEVLLIGDSVHDYEVAEEIGAASVLISTGHQAETKLKKVTQNVYPSMNSFLLELQNLKKY